jgi:hypothetical protein
VRGYDSIHAERYTETAAFRYLRLMQDDSFNKGLTRHAGR